MKAFTVTIRTAAHSQTYTALAATSAQAAADAADLFIEACGITVMPAGAK